MPTGIEGLDRLIGGGLRRGTWTLVHGPPGSGKTIFGMHWAWEGIARGEAVAYDSLERPFAYVRAYFDAFGWKIGPLEVQGRFVPVQGFPQYAIHHKEPHIAYYNPASIEEGRAVAMELGRRQVRRVVRDELAWAVWAELPVPDILERYRWTLAWAFGAGITGIDLLSGPGGRPEADRLRAIVEETVNNVVHLRVRDNQREMKIVKMEATEHPLDWLPFNITAQGIVL
jgi:KaiC/GvpD/RAD55 family RecA-like ATPase